MTSKVCTKWKTPAQNLEVAPCRSPHEGLHAKRHSSHPSKKLSIPMRLQGKVQGRYNSSQRQGQRSQSSQYSQPVKNPLQQDVPCINRTISSILGTVHPPASNQLSSFWKRTKIPCLVLHQRRVLIHSPIPL